MIKFLIHIALITVIYKLLAIHMNFILFAFILECIYFLGLFILAVVCVFLERRKTPEEKFIDKLNDIFRGL